MFRQRVVETLPPAPPRWGVRPDFDLDFHMRRVSAPVPGTVEGCAGDGPAGGDGRLRPGPPDAEGHPDRGPDDGGAAVLCKFHHALTVGSAVCRSR